MRKKRRIPPAVKRVAQRIASIWAGRQVSTGAAAVAFYAVLALAPTLVFATAAATYWLGEEASQQLVTERVEQLVGPESAGVARSILESSSYDKFSEQTVLATAPSAAMLLLGASGMFAQLRQTLSRVFGRESVQGRQAVLAWLVGRVVSTVGAIVGGLLVLASLLGSVVVPAVTSWLSRTLGVQVGLWGFANTPLTVGFVFVVLCAVFWALPAKRPPWRYLWIGAVVSTLGFEAGRWVFGAYIAQSVIASAYGPASSLVAFLLWVYYTTIIVFFGAVVAQAISEEGRAAGA